MRRLTILALVSHIFPSLSRADVCNNVEKFNNYNATRTYSIPALRINGSRSGDSAYYKILEDPDNMWYLTDRFAGANLASGSDGLQYPWLNVGDSNTTNIGMCMDTTWTHSLGKYYFSKEVLERSVNDNGDCKTMLGEECVSALESHYKKIAAGSMTRGNCQTGSFSNLTVPYQCASLVGGGDQWLGAIASFGSTLNATLEGQSYNSSNCPSPPLNSSMFGGYGTGGAYNQSIRFPQPWFFTFWPNQTGQDSVQTSWSEEDVHVQIMCLRPDEFKEGSVVPPSAEELLKRDDVKFPTSGGVSGKAGGINAMGLPIVLGVAGTIAALLM